MLVLLLAGACAGGDSPAPFPTGGGSAHAFVARPDQDTVRFTIPVVLRHCRPPRAGLLFEAVGGGNGILVWLRSADLSASGDSPVFPILGVRDTVTKRGAVVAVRYMTGEMAHGYSLDSGAVIATDSGGRLALRVSGSGLETPGAFRPLLDATIENVVRGGSTTPGDSVPCEPLP